MPEPSIHDPYDLTRFVLAQQFSFDQALSEVQKGRKYSHWMWFIFPQLRGLGRSETSDRYGLSGVNEARAYLEHEVLGPRLLEICEALLNHDKLSAVEVFGRPDNMKLRSCATLFVRVSGPNSVFQRILDQFFGGKADYRTAQLLRQSEDGE